MAIVVRKIFLSVIILLLLCSCNNKIESGDDNLVFSEGIILDGTTARKVADIILVDTLKKDISDYSFVTTSFQKQNDIWQITYSIDEFTIGGDITVELSKTSGEISVIYGE